MKSTSLFRAALAAFLLSPALLSAQLLYDGFDYTAGNTLGSNGWNLIGSSGGAATNVVTQNLSMVGFGPSEGNAVELRPNGQDWYRTYATQTYTSTSNDSLYYSFLMRVDSLGLLDATGGLFVSLADGTGTSGQSASVWLRSSAGGFQIGISKRNASPVFASQEFTVGTTVLLAASYNLVSGPVNNDTASLWINPGSLGSVSPPAATLTTPVSGINDDVIQFSNVVLRPQGTATSTQIPASLIFDEVRVGNTWAVITPVPEPGVTALIALGFVGGIVFRRIRARREA